MSDIVMDKPFGQVPTGAHPEGRVRRPRCRTPLWTSPSGRTYPGPRAEYTHIAFSVPAERFAEASARVLAAGARPWKDDRSEGQSLYILDPDGHKLELHVGDLAERLAACRRAPYEGMVFFDTGAPDS